MLRYVAVYVCTYVYVCMHGVCMYTCMCVCKCAGTYLLRCVVLSCVELCCFTSACIFNHECGEAFRCRVDGRIAHAEIIRQAHHIPAYVHVHVDAFVCV